MYKYQSWSSGNEDCYSWTTKSTSGFMEIYGAKPNKFKVGDEVRFSWFNNTLTGKISHIKGYKLYNAESNGCIYRDIIEDDIHFIKGKDNNMTNITVKIMGGKKTDYARAIKAEFDIDAPKFKVGDKIKLYIKDFNWKQGVVYTVSKQVNISSTQNEKNFKIDNVQWHYVIIESGTLKTHNGVREDHVKIDDTPDYNKYFDLMKRSGIDFDKIYYDIFSFDQTYANGGYDTRVTLKSKINHKLTQLLFWVNNAHKLPAISEKC